MVSAIFTLLGIIFTIIQKGPETWRRIQDPAETALRARVLISLIALMTVIYAVQIDEMGLGVLAFAFYPLVIAWGTRDEKRTQGESISPYMRFVLIGSILFGMCATIYGVGFYFDWIEVDEEITATRVDNQIETNLRIRETPTPNYDPITPTP